MKSFLKLNIINIYKYINYIYKSSYTNLVSVWFWFGLDFLILDIKSTQASDMTKPKPNFLVRFDLIFSVRDKSIPGIGETVLYHSWNFSLALSLCDLLVGYVLSKDLGLIQGLALPNTE